MTKIDDILEEFRKGTSLREIIKKYGDAGPLHRAYEQYRPEMEHIIQQKRNELAPLSSKVKGLNDHIEALEKREKELTGSISSLEKEHERRVREWTEEENKYQKRLEALRKDLDRENKEFKDLNLKLSDLSKRGVTIELVARIQDMQVKSGKDLLKRVETSEKYDEVEKNLSKMQDNIQQLQKEISSYTKTLENLRDNIQLEKNAFDELQSKTRTFQEAIKITVWFFTKGYKTADLKSIKDGIELVGVKDNPTLSIDRLIRGVDEAGSLNNIQDIIKKSKEELETLQDEIASAEGKLTAIQGIVIKAIDLTKDNAVSQIENLGNNSVLDISKLRDDIENALKDLEKKAKGNLRMLIASSLSQIRNTANKSCVEIGTVEKEAVKSLTNIHTEINTVRDIVSDSIKEVQANGQKDIGEFIKQCQQVLNEIQKASLEEREQQKANREEWGKIQEQSGKLVAEIKRANTLLALNTDPQELNLITKADIQFLLVRMIEWYRQQKIFLTVKLIQLDPSIDIGLKPISFVDTMNWCLRILQSTF